MYVERWLKAPTQAMSGEIEEREKGTPQGGVISPILSNLFMHYALNRWLQSNSPTTPLERYTDDVIVHCRNQTETHELKAAIAERLNQCGLELHSDKTKIVYCQDGIRLEHQRINSFGFLGYGLWVMGLDLDYRELEMVSTLPISHQRYQRRLRKRSSLKCASGNCRGVQAQALKT